MPGSRLTTLKPPLSSVVAVTSLFVPLFLAATAAPATTSLLGFMTVPFIAPVVVDCAIALRAQVRTTKSEAKQNRRDLDMTGELLKIFSNVVDHFARERSGAELTETFENALSCWFRRIAVNNCRRRFLS